MAVLPNLEITSRDLDDPGLSMLNNHLRQIVTEINRLNGLHGAIALNNNIDLQNSFQIVNNNQADAIPAVSYSFVAADQGKFKVFTNQSSVMVAVNSQLSKAKFNCRFLFIGANGGQITPTTGKINGATSKPFTQGQGGNLYFDGTNWWVL